MKSIYELYLEGIGKRLGYKGNFIYVRYRKIAEIVNSLNSKTVLDAGCGLGIFDHYLTNVTVHGIDTSNSEIEEARKLTHEFGGNYTYEQSDILKYSTTQKFDIVICSEVIEHVQYPEKVLKCLKSFVAENGYIVISVPNRDQLRNRVRRLFCLPDVLMDETHIREYNFREIEELIKNSGLRIIKKDVAVLYFPLENLVSKVIKPDSHIRRFLIKVFPHISSHLIYLCSIV